MYVTEHTSLTLATLDRAGHDRTCGYWYCIRTDGSTPHTAFARRESLLEWLEATGLKLTAPLPEHGQHSWQRLEGTYSSAMHLSYDEFFALPAIMERRTLSNGEYTLGRITEENGRRTLHSLNPNCKHRPVFDYFESRAMVG